MRSNHLGTLITGNDADLAARQENHPDFDGIAGTPDVVLPGCTSTRQWVRST